MEKWAVYYEGGDPEYFGSFAEAKAGLLAATVEVNSMQSRDDDEIPESRVGYIESLVDLNAG